MLAASKPELDVVAATDDDEAAAVAFGGAGLLFEKSSSDRLSSASRLLLLLLVTVLLVATAVVAEAKAFLEGTVEEDEALPPPNGLWAAEAAAMNVFVAGAALAAATCANAFVGFCCEAPWPKMETDGVSAEADCCEANALAEEEEPPPKTEGEEALPPTAALVPKTALLAAPPKGIDEEDDEAGAPNGEGAALPNALADVADAEGAICPSPSPSALPSR